ncbi:MAG TPA: hypothetical protein VM053_01575 [Gemmatimonadaceae bacterium]|nr:hypothetical protein [Gemmatimonadaceae bacterium]
MRCSVSGWALFGCVLVAGCAHVSFRQVAISAGDDMGALPLTARTFFVVPNVQMTDTALEGRVRARVEQALLDKGYILAPAENAELYVMASFGAVDRFALSDLSIFQAATMKADTAPNGRISRKYTPERMDHPQILSLKNSISVLVSASDAKTFRETGQVKPLWRAEASIPAKPELLREMVPYLLHPTLQYFGRSSGGVRSVDVSDKEIKRWPQGN